MDIEFKFNVGDRVIILNKKQPKYYKQIGVIDFMEYFGGDNYCSVVCDDDSLNITYTYGGRERHNSDIFWREDTIRLANLNRRI
jgi:hypothetical protein